jgi:hypothetical protein
MPLPIIYVPRLRLSIWREEHFPAYLLLITYYLLLITYYLLLITYYLLLITYYLIGVISNLKIQTQQ